MRCGGLAARGKRVVLDLHQVSLTRLAAPDTLPGRHLMPTKFSPAAIKPQVSLEDLNKLDIRVGTIELVEKVQHSDKLVRLRVDFGDWPEKGAFKPEGRNRREASAVCD